MAPNIKDQLPILNRILQFFKREGLVIDSPLFRLHHQVKIHSFHRSISYCSDSNIRPMLGFEIDNPLLKLHNQVNIWLKDRQPIVETTSPGK